MKHLFQKVTSSENIHKNASHTYAKQLVVPLSFAKRYYVYSRNFIHCIIFFPHIIFRKPWHSASHAHNCTMHTVKTSAGLFVYTVVIKGSIIQRDTISMTFLFQKLSNVLGGFHTQRFQNQIICFCHLVLTQLCSYVSVPQRDLTE